MTTARVFIRDFLFSKVRNIDFFAVIELLAIFLIISVIVFVGTSV